MIKQNNRFNHRYNTLETERTLRGTDILALHNIENCYTAYRTNVPCLVRRSIRNMEEADVVIPTHSNLSQNEFYVTAMQKLDEMLKVEENAGRFSPEIGFYS